MQRTDWQEFFLFFFFLFSGMIPKSFFLFVLAVISAKVQTVSQPGNGHHIKFGLVSTSIIQNINSMNFGVDENDQKNVTFVELQSKIK